jgi:hypothetical protein
MPTKHSLLGVGRGALEQMSVLRLVSALQGQRPHLPVLDTVAMSCPHGVGSRGYLNANNIMINVIHEVSREPDVGGHATYL